MLCEVSGSKGDVCTTHLCHSEKEVGDAVFNLADLLDIPMSVRFAALPVIAFFLLGTGPDTLQVEGITLRHLPKEEYEKWQQAF